MKRFLPLFFAIFILLCTNCGGASNLSTADFTIEEYTPEYAQGFSILRTEHSKSSLICIHNPWQGTQMSKQYLFIARNGEKIPEGFTGQVIKAPVRHAVCMSSSHVAFFDALGQILRVSGVSGIDYISNEHVNAHKLCGEVRDVGYDTNLNFELLAAMRPDIILLYGVSGENTLITGKLNELNIPYIYIGDFVEESPLGKAEWMMVIAEMTNCQDTGREVFAGIRDRYETLRRSVKREKRPRVMLNTPYRDTWYMPSSRSYMIRLIEDAGGEYVYNGNDSKSSAPVDIEEAYLLANSADYWINLGAVNTLQELTSQNPKFTTVPAVLNGRIYNNNKRQTPAGGSDFWESGVVYPDRVLKDLIHIFDGRDEELYFYQKIE